MKVLGIDPGFAIVGFGLVRAEPGRRPAALSCGAINTPAGEPLPARLVQIADDLDVLLERFRPDALAIDFGVLYPDGAVVTYDCEGLTVDQVWELANPAG